MAFAMASGAAAYAAVAEASSMKAAVEKMRFMVIFRFQIDGIFV